MPVRLPAARILCFRRPAFRRIAFGLCSAITGVTMAMPLQAQGSGSAWSLPDPNGLLTQVIRRIVTQDKPGGLPIAGYTEHTFGREETVAAVRAFTQNRAVVAPAIFSAVSEWPVAHESDAWPCAQSRTLADNAASNAALANTPAPSVVSPGVTSPGPASLSDVAATSDSAATGCGFSNALWLAVTKVERGDLPHELHVWYATRFRTDVQGSVLSATYSFCERWLRIGGVWKYDGFVRMAKGVVAPTIGQK